MNEEKLFEELVKRGIINKKESEKVLRGAELSGNSGEDILYERRMADEDEVAKIKAEISNLPYRQVNSKEVPDDLLKLIPYETSRTYKVIPIELKDDMLIVGMVDPENTQAQNALKFIAKQSGYSLGVYIVSISAVRKIWRRYRPYKSEIQAAVQELGIDRRREQDLVGLEEGVESSQDAPIIKIVASTLRHAVDAIASDIHIEPQRDRLRVRFRIDGDLHQVAELPVGLSQPVISRVKVLSQMKLDETRIPQDGRFRTIVFGRDIDFRVSTFPTPSGEKVAIRVLDPTAGVKSVEELGLQDYNMETLREAVEDPYGMILITGPTGSGKSTTLYAIMNKLNTEEVNVVTLEDPVEYFMAGLNQSQVMPELGYSFSSGLRQILRQDPDVIMVGEIRDGETAGLAVNAALTGHLMLSTLHTNNSVGVIPRLIDLGVPSFLLSSSLNIMVAQRLVSKLCPNCKKEVEASPEVSEVIDSEIEKMPEKIREKMKAKHKKPYHIYQPEPDENCEICKGKGTYGRMAIFEIFKMTRELGNVISGGFTEDKLWQEAERQGMITLRQDGIIKALQGDVLIEEILRETEE
jgi:type IV pilus assembly protein PilB